MGDWSLNSILRFRSVLRVASFFLSCFSTGKGMGAMVYAGAGGAVYRSLNILPVGISTKLFLAWGVLLGQIIFLLKCSMS